MGWRDSLGEWGFNKWNVRKFLDQNLLCFWKISENPLLALKGQLVDFFFPLLSPYCISAAPRQASNKSKWLFLRQKHLCDLWEHSNPNNQAGSQVAQTTGKQSQYLRGLSSASEAKLSRILFFSWENQRQTTLRRPTSSKYFPTKIKAHYQKNYDFSFTYQNVHHSKCTQWKQWFCHKKYENSHYLLSALLHICVLLLRIYQPNKYMNMLSKS